jgi:lipoate-protein ligase A
LISFPALYIRSPLSYNRNVEKWRAILDDSRSASFNMAADAYFLEAAERGPGPPVLRLYGWNRPSITIGYHQKFDRAVDLSRLNNTPVVRRVTGGRALLHDDGELTYAMAGNFHHYPGLGLTLHESYHLISQAIVLFYRELGWPASTSHRDQPLSISASDSTQKGCFAAVSRYEITVAGRKMAAGSQRRTKTSFVQHGAIKITAPGRHPAIAGSLQEPEAEYLKGLDVRPNEMRRILLAQFEQVYGISFVKSPLSADEKAAIEGLRPHFGNLNLD